MTIGQGENKPMIREWTLDQLCELLDTYVPRVRITSGRDALWRLAEGGITDRDRLVKIVALACSDPGVLEMLSVERVESADDIIRHVTEWAFNP